MTELIDWSHVDLPEFRAWDAISEEVRFIEGMVTTSPEMSRRIARLVRDFTTAGALTHSAAEAAEKRVELLRPIVSAGGVEDEPPEGAYFGVLAEVLGSYFDRGAAIAREFEEERRTRAYPQCYTTQEATPWKTATP